LPSSNFSERKPSFTREKKRHTKVLTSYRRRKYSRKEEKLVTLMSSSNTSFISNRNLIHQIRKAIQKYLHLVEEENIREKKKSLYFCCLLQTNSLI